MNYARRLLTEWNVCRIVRLGFGIPILLVGIRESHWPSAVFGAAFAAAGLFSLACCASGGCTVTPARKQPASAPVEFEEIK